MKRNRFAVCGLVALFALAGAARGDVAYLTVGLTTGCPYGVPN
jgi:hypothetical protein